MSNYICGATADIGVERESQEDFVQYKELGNNLLCVIADGTGSVREHSQPATIVVMDIIETFSNIYKKEPEILKEKPEFFLELAMRSANRILGALKMGNEELFYGYAASVTCCYITEDQKLYVAHSGNTRLYLMRNGLLKQLTKDHTKAAELLNEGKIDLGTYHVHPDRLKLTSGLGVVLDPEIQVFRGSLKDQDLLLLTTDGIHYAIQPEAMAEIILRSEDCIPATQNLIDAAKNIIKYPDNMSAILIRKENLSLPK